jgi:hypothetical protein
LLFVTVLPIYLKGIQVTNSIIVLITISTWGVPLTITFCFYDSFLSLLCFRFPRSATFLYWVGISLSQHKEVEMEKNVSAVQEQQVAATAKFDWQGLLKQEQQRQQY